MKQVVFHSYLPMVSYYRPNGDCISITKQLILDDTAENKELISELTKIAQDPGSPIYLTDTVPQLPEQAVQTEMLEKAKQIIESIKK